MDVEGFGFNREFLKKHPEIMQIVYEAINDDWTETRFQARLQNTKWWKTKTESQRQWDLLIVQQPEERLRRIEQGTGLVRDLAGQMGVKLTPQQMERISANAARNGLDEGEIRDLVAAKWNPSKMGSTGQAGASVDGLRRMAQDYGVRLSADTLVSWTRGILGGQQTVESFTDTVREQSKRLYKTVSKELDNGATIRDLMSPYMEAAASALGTPVSDMDLTDPKWTKALRSQENKGEAMDMDEWTRTIRQGQEFDWDSTSQARQQAATFASNLAQMFGGQ
jgi:hypothetical protein